MSYDLMVFEKSKAPHKREKFMEWYFEQTEWNENRDYNSIEGTADKLKSWFMEMIETFPPMNGEFSDESNFDDPDKESYVTDYCIGNDVIYTAFAWSVCEEAYSKMRELAQKHDVGFFDVSADNGELLFWE